MKLEFPTIEIERSNTFESKNFSFGDPRVIMNILRSKMYSNPPYTIVQEIASNSRDANREAGRGERPIEIVLPSKLDEHLKFIDCGVGISPARMRDVYTFYGNSTKRHDNSQTGGFGLGAKTPFAYTDTFTITTTTEDDDGKRRRRVYIAYIDESQLGAVDKVSEEPTSEETGTTISIVVRPNDTKSFVSAIKKVTHHWKPRPIIHGTFSYDDESIDIGGADWHTTKQSYGAVPEIIIDGVPYTLQKDIILSSMDGTNKSNVRNLLALPLRVFFPTGELAVTANREDLDYQPDVIAKISQKILAILDELTVKSTNDIKGAANLFEASAIWNELSNNTRALVFQPKWNGHDLITKAIQHSRAYRHYGQKQFDSKAHVTLAVYEYKNGLVDTVSKWGRGTRVQREIPFDRKYLLVEDDKGGGNKLRMESIFTSPNPPRYIGLVHPRDKEGLDWLESNFSWSLLGAVKLSSFAKKQHSIPGVQVKRSGYTVHRVKELIKEKGAYTTKYKWSGSTRAVEDNLGGLYVLLRDNRAILGDNSTISKESIMSLQEILGVQIFGILSKWASKINSAWTELQAGVLKHIVDEQSSRAFKDYIAFGYKERYSALDLMDPTLYNLIEGCGPRILKRWVNFSKRAQEGGVKFDRCERLRILAHLPHFKLPTKAFSGLETIHSCITSKWPLLNHDWSSISEPLLANEILFYLNSKDAK